MSHVLVSNLLRIPLNFSLSMLFSQLATGSDVGGSLDPQSQQQSESGGVGVGGGGGGRCDLCQGTDEQNLKTGQQEAQISCSDCHRTGRSI